MSRSTISTFKLFELNGVDVTITDERCACGQLRSQHEDTIAFGHGPLANRPNFCPKFTWVGFITA